MQMFVFVGIGTHVVVVGLVVVGLVAATLVAEHA